MTNPFSVGIAQTIADVPLNSGVAYRAVIFAVFEMVSIWYVMRYARKVKQNPELSVLYGCDEVERSDKKQYDKEVNFTFRRKLCTILFFATIGILLYGTSMLGWYIDEISSLFLAMMVVAGVVGGSSLNEICLTFIESTKSVVSSILVIGFTRGILIVMKEALISDTIFTTFLLFWISGIPSFLLLECCFYRASLIFSLMVLPVRLRSLANYSTCS